jgi:hypothetical protein
LRLDLNVEEKGCAQSNRGYRQKRAFHINDVSLRSSFSVCGRPLRLKGSG